MIPFNIEQYNTGNYDVVYRNGAELLEWNFYEKTKRIVSFYIKRGDDPAMVIHSERGRALYTEAGFDLMLKPQEKWVEYNLRFNDLFIGIQISPSQEAIIKQGWGKSEGKYKLRINQTTHEATIEKIEQK